MRDWGRFPFGKRNTVRPARRAESPRAVVIGVYPSAWHVSWSAPGALGDPTGRKGKVAALAVDVEPEVFWDGTADDFEERLATWKRHEDVTFVEGDGAGRHGRIADRSPSTNGSSGAKVVEHYLRPLGLDPGEVTSTDVFPVFMVKRAGERARRREQGDAIAAEYDTIAHTMGKQPSSLPTRIPPARLPSEAAKLFGSELVEEIRLARPDLVIALGSEVWDTFRLIPDLRVEHRGVSFDSLYGSRYGETGTLRVDGRSIDWLPLVHPGLLKGSEGVASGVDPARRTVGGWNLLHAAWVERHAG
jgi:hypothetical protein